MLDQNTDRMWYVIGAILIGAAILFGMNVFMPSAFASVSDMFQTTTANIVVPTNNPNLLKTTTLQNGYIKRSDGTFVPLTSYDENESTGYIDVSDLDVITVTFYDTITDPIPESVGGVVWGYDANKQPVQNILTDIRWTEPTSETLDVSEYTYIRANLIHQDILRYKIEAGTESTPYS